MILWNLEEVARQLGGVSTATVRRMIHRNAFPAVRVGVRIMVPQATRCPHKRIKQIEADAD